MNFRLVKILTLVTIVLCLAASGCSSKLIKGPPDRPFIETNGGRSTSTWHARTIVPNVENDATDGGACMVSGNPAFCYMDESSRDLYYVRALDADGTTWGTPVLVDSAGSEFCGAYASMVMVNGSPAIAYCKAWDLYYVRADDAYGASGQWGSPQLLDDTGSQVGSYPKLAIVSDNPAITYWGGLMRGMAYIRADDEDGDSWGDPILIGAGNLYYSRPVMISGRPAIAYTGWHYPEGDSFYYLRADDANGDSWTVNNAELIEAGVSDTGAPDLIETSSGPFIAYPQLKYDALLNDVVTKATGCLALDSTGSSWDSAFNLDPEPIEPMGMQLTTVGGSPCLACVSVDVGPNRIKLLRATSSDGSTWASPEVIGEAYAFDLNFFVCNDKPAIVSLTPGDVDVSFFSSVDEHGIATGLAQTLTDTGGTPVTSYISGNPAIAYTSGTNLKYRRATDNQGYSWSTTRSVASNCASAISMSQVEYTNPVSHEKSFVPAICYYSTSNSHLYYTYALDPDGATWDTAVELTTSGSYGVSCSMANIAGNPAIAYLETTNGTLMYIRATDPAGENAWSSSVSVDANADQLYGVSMVQTRGGTTYPAIAYTPDILGQSGLGNLEPRLCYIRASNSTGTSWGSPIILDSSTGVPFPSLGFTGSNYPAVAYMMPSLTTLKYCSSNNTEGTSWDSPKTIDTDCLGDKCSTQKIESRPGIVYSGETGGLKYAEPEDGNSDPNGESDWIFSEIDIFGDNVGFRPSMLESASDAIFTAYSVVYPSSTSYIRVYSSTPEL